MSRELSHGHHDKSYELLDAARATAAKSRRYDSVWTRAALVDRFKNSFVGLQPHDWQLDVTEAVLLGLDCIVIAGTGAGKTMPFAMPLLLDENKDKIVVVISPLNELEHDQVSSTIVLSISCCLVTFSRLNDLRQLVLRQRQLTARFGMKCFIRCT
jgi:ATP-dependent helicase YprA (DUF1998 family)